MADNSETTQRAAIIGAGASLAGSLLDALAAKGITAEVLEDGRRPKVIEPWQLPWDSLGKPKPINAGRRAEKDAAALAKAEAKRARKAAKRAKDATG